MRISDHLRVLRSVRLIKTDRPYSTASTVMLNDILKIHLRNNRIDDARILFDESPTSRNIASWNTMIALHFQNNQLRHAQDLFDQMPDKDVILWNTLLCGLRKANDSKGVYARFLQMQILGFRPNDYTISVVLNAVLNTAFNVLVSQIHVLAIRLGFNSNLFVGSALIKGYANVKDHAALSKVFDEIVEENISSWNALVSGYMEMGCKNQAQKVYESMPEKNLASSTILIKGYIDNKNTKLARQVFNNMSERNVFSWTTMISGYVKSNKFLDALKLFLLMSRSGISPNEFTFSSVLDSCAGCNSLLMGQQVHASIIKLAICGDIIVSTSLVDMYAKNGDIDAALCVFEFMPVKNLVSWNSMIGGYARHGLATKAVDQFERMIKEGNVVPDEITFINVLSACGYGGLVEEGEKYFNTMWSKFRIRTSVEHYTCMVDMYGRAGQLEKAEKLIKEMPFEPDVVVWGAFLGACGMHSSLELGEFAAEKLNELKSDHPAIYTMFCKIYSEKGAWSHLNKLKGNMKGKRVKKQRAGSWVESSFVVTS